MKNRLSYSAVERYNVCPRAYFYHDIAKIREKVVGSALVFGSAMDSALNALMKPGSKEDPYQAFEDSWRLAKINEVEERLSTTDNVRYSLGDLDVSVLDEATSKRLKRYIDQADILIQKRRSKLMTPKDEKVYNFLAWHSLRAKGRMMIDAYLKEIKPNVKRVIAVQKSFMLENEEEDRFIGFIDMICEWKDGRIVVFDHKTTSSNYTEDSVKESRQLATYFTVEDSITRDNLFAGFIVLHKNIRKKDPRVKVQIFIDKIPDDLIEKVFEDYDTVNTKTKNGDFTKNYDSCERPMPYGRCAFYGLCHEGKMDGLVDLTRRRRDEDERR